MVLKETASINNASDSSKKCPGCGLRNFAGANKCKRCKSDLSAPLKVTKNEKRVPADSAESDRSHSVAWVVAVLVVVALGLVLFYMKQGPQETPEPGSEAVVAQTSVAPDAEQPVKSAAEQNSQSEAVAKQIVTNLKGFQDATEGGMDFKEYQQKLNSLRSDLKNALPSFDRHLPGDETFRKEVASALRDYTAAENWWKTTIRDSTVFTETDRKERTQISFESARAHLENAEKSLGR
jgi:hypothetical protein